MKPTTSAVISKEFSRYRIGDIPLSRSANVDLFEPPVTPTISAHQSPVIVAMIAALIVFALFAVVVTALALAGFVMRKAWGMVQVEGARPDYSPIFGEE
jgi:hypothetical protein